MVDVSTIDAPFANDQGFNAPNFAIGIQGAELPLGVRRLIKHVEFESVDGMADALKLTIEDPDIIAPKGLIPAGSLGGLGAGGGGSGIDLALRDTKIFQPGNTVSLAMGYGATLDHIGLALIRKTRPIFPENGTPTIQVVAYDKGVLMMDNAPEGSKKKKGKGGRTFNETTFADAVRDRVADYDFDFVDVDDTVDAPHKFIQKVGLSDYDFIQGLSNITGYFFWVDGSADGKWTIHFKNPDTLAAEDLQDEKFTFKYNAGNLTSLLSFQPELAIQGVTTKLQVRVKDPKTGRIFEAEFEEDNNEAPDPEATVTEFLRVADNESKGEQTTASDIKIFINDFSFQPITNRRFTSEAEVIAWAKQWFRRERENFVLSRGKTIGVSKFLSKQIHRLEGVSKGLSGDYFFNRVRHIMNDSDGYICDFSSRKVVPGLA